MLWAEKYAPDEIGDVAGNPSAVEHMEKWAKRGGKALLLVGPPGVGKTAAALALARTMGWELLEMNSGNLRSKAAVERFAGLASTSATFSGKGRVILFDEIDGMFRQDRGGSTAVLHIIRQANCPVILTAGDAYAKALSTIRKECEIVKFKRIHYSTIGKVLERICEAEGIQAEREVLLEIARVQHGDLKGAINDLQAVAQGRVELLVADLDSVGKRDRKSDIFNAVRTVLKTMDFHESKGALDSIEADPDFFMKWIEENVPREYERPEDLFAAMQMLSRANIFQARIIKRQDWSLLKYVIVLCTAGVSLAKKEPYHKFTPYQFPSFIRKLSASKGRRGTLKRAAAKIGAGIHSSSGEVIKEHLPYFSQLFKAEATAVPLIAQFELDDAEVALLCECTAAKAKKLCQKAGELREEYISSKL